MSERVPRAFSRILKESKASDGTVDVIITCGECGHPHHLQRRPQLGETVYVVCHNCEAAPLRYDLPRAIPVGGP